MKNIIFTRPDGGVTVRSPSPRRLAEFEDEVEGMAAIQARNLPAGATDVVQVDEADIPTDRTFRNAWKHSGGVFSVDMSSARDIQATRVEIAKREKARDLIERDMMGEDITADKAALQGISVASQIAAAKTPNALKAVWPDILEEN